MRSFKPQNFCTVRQASATLGISSPERWLGKFSVASCNALRSFKPAVKPEEAFATLLCASAVLDLLDSAPAVSQVWYRAQVLDSSVCVAVDHAITARRIRLQKWRCCLGISSPDV